MFMKENKNFAYLAVLLLGGVSVGAAYILVLTWAIVKSASYFKGQQTFFDTLYLAFNLTVFYLALKCINKAFRFCYEEFRLELFSTSVTVTSARLGENFLTPPPFPGNSVWIGGQRHLLPSEKETLEEWDEYLADSSEQ